MKGYAMGFEKGHESSGKSSKDSKLRKAYMLFSVLAVGLIIFSSFRGGLSGLIQRSTFDEVMLIVCQFQYKIISVHFAYCKFHKFSVTVEIRLLRTKLESEDRNLKFDWLDFINQGP